MAQQEVYQVYNDLTDEVIKEFGNDFWGACDWMMEHYREFDTYNVGVDAIGEDGSSTGWWTIADLFDANPNGWNLPDGVVIIDEREDK